ncbi:NADH:ubiquinone oxidoreductase [Vibrio aestuarianus]|uniref:NADH:ubiquinone oxidoreductase n=1 Tax=Vibrio aestuarianus TaxID=28171 RepID=UPI00237D065A|nr:NADH:ubiquinone oxidoreductase [Vibrio aestuarianus]MDE1315986.1 NADH:ubiquinone oxidoreductase [Vibrio aestuarianus]
MKLILILIASVSAGVASAEHFHSFLLGLYVSSLAVGTCYWFAFRSTRVPEFALFLLICGLFAKLSVTIVGVMWGVSADLITSPIVFALSYMFFSIVVTYIWFSYRDKKTPTPKLYTQV